MSMRETYGTGKVIRRHDPFLSVPFCIGNTHMSLFPNAEQKGKHKHQKAEKAEKAEKADMKYAEKAEP